MYIKIERCMDVKRTSLCNIKTDSQKDSGIGTGTERELRN